jgi:single-strand DNA-binding protein
MNQFIGIGRLTADPELRYTDKGVPRCWFSIAINERGKEREHTEYVDCVAWEKLAETIAEYARKGRLVAVVGSLRREEYQHQGDKRTRHRIRVQSCQFLDRPQQPAEKAEHEDLSGLSF